MSRNTNPLLPWLRLARVPAVFTALADIFAGYLLTHTEWEPYPRFLSLVGASACLYLSGMVFNDVFDLKQDREERPSRPIPSGAIGLRQAVIFGAVLMACGLGLSLAAGWNSLIIGVAIAAAIFAYDGGLKKTVLGPFAMGLCRVLNLLLGASSGTAEISQVWAMPQLWVAIAMGIYISGVTWFARSEARISRRLPLVGGLALINLGLLLLAGWMLGLPGRLGIDMGPVGTTDLTGPLVLWGAIAFSLNRRLLIAIRNPVPGNVQPAIGTLLLSIITINAMTILFRLGNYGIVYVGVTLLLILPAILSRRWISMT